MKRVNFVNEKNNVSVKVREEIRKQAYNAILGVLDSQFEDVVENANGGISIPLAIDDRTSATVYATLDLTISTADPSVKKEKKKSSKKADKEDASVPNLFA